MVCGLLSGIYITWYYNKYNEIKKKRKDRKRGRRMKMSFGAVLTIVFIVLKLTHVIAWS